MGAGNCSRVLFMSNTTLNNLGVFLELNLSFILIAWDQRYFIFEFSFFFFFLDFGMSI